MRILSSKSTRIGATLVELMVAIPILAIVALTGGTLLFQSRREIDMQKNKRVALDVVNGRMEELKALGYGFIENLPLPKNYSVRYLSKSGSAWAPSASDPRNTVSVNGTTVPITATVQYVDIDGGAATYDCIRVTVKAGYREGLADLIPLETLLAP